MFLARYNDRPSVLKVDTEVQTNGRKGTDQHTAPEKLEQYFKENRDPVVSESVGAQWYESRDYWRAELAKHFPEPSEATIPTD